MKHDSQFWRFDTALPCCANRLLSCWHPTRYIHQQELQCHRRFFLTISFNAINTKDDHTTIWFDFRAEVFNANTQSRGGEWRRRVHSFGTFQMRGSSLWTMLWGLVTTRKFAGWHKLDRLFETTTFPSLISRVRNWGVRIREYLLIFFFHSAWTGEGRAEKQ